MSLADEPRGPREFRLSENLSPAYIASAAQESVAPSEPVLSTPEPFETALYGDLYAKGAHARGMDAPPLPQKNALRASRLLDNLGLKLGGSLETHEVGQTTPLDMYLSSEEDASSSADDFSDYDYDSDSDGVQSPTRSRRSHEDTARVVSVVYIGKPSIIDLSMLPSRRQSCIGTVSSLTSRPSTSSTSLSSLNRPATTSTLLPAGLAGKKRPPFLNIDPFANGSTYSLAVPKETLDGNAPKPPRTPTALLKGVTRTFSLVRKRSRPQLAAPAPAPASPARDLHTSPDEAPLRTPRTPASPVTYNDILKAARKNALQQQTEPTPASPPPASPNTQRKSFLGGLASRRRSIKIVNGRLHSGGP